MEVNKGKKKNLKNTDNSFMFAPMDKAFHGGKKGSCDQFVPRK